MVRVFKILFHPLTRPVGLVRFFLLSIAGQVQDLQRGLFGGEMASPHRCFAEVEPPWLATYVIQNE